MEGDHVDVSRASVGQRSRLERLPTEVYAAAFFIGQLIGGMAVQLAGFDASLVGLTSLAGGVVASFVIHAAGYCAHRLQRIPSLTGPIYVLLMVLGAGLSELIAVGLGQFSVPYLVRQICEGLPIPFMLIAGETFGRTRNWKASEAAHTAAMSSLVFVVGVVVAAIVVSPIFTLFNLSDGPLGQTMMMIIVVLLATGLVFYADSSDRSGAKSRRMVSVRPERCPLYLFLLLCPLFLALYYEAAADIRLADRLMDEALEDVEEAEEDLRAAARLEQAGRQDVADQMRQQVTRRRAEAVSGFRKIVEEYGDTTSAIHARESLKALERSEP